MVSEEVHKKKEKELKETIKEKDEEIREQRQRLKNMEQKFKSSASEFKKQFAKQTLDLMTAAFGLVAALAWNSLIQEVIKTYVQPLLGESSGVVSQLVYALFVTALAVFVTYQLGKMAGDKKN